MSQVLTSHVSGGWLQSGRMKRSPALLYVPLAGLLLAAVAPRAWAFDAVELEAREITVAGLPVSGMRVRLDVLDDTRTRLFVGARAVTLPAPVGTLSDLALIC